jgi:hypothetical protein
MANSPLDYSAPPLQSNRLATASLIVGVLGFLIPILGGLAAILLGYAALRKIREGRAAGRGLAIAGIGLGSVGILVNFVILFMLISSGGRPRSYGGYSRVKCASNLRQIGQAILLYANENHGQCPPRFEDLILTEDIGSEVFTCPSSNDTKAPGATPQAQAQNLSAGGHLSYIYLGAGHTLQPNSNPDSTAVLAYEPLSNHVYTGQAGTAGINVLYFNGHVTFIPAPQAQQLIQTLKSLTPTTNPHP